MNTNSKRPSMTLEGMRQRLGRRFPLLPGPLSARQKKWKQYLPWRVWAEMIDDRAAAMRAALGIADDTPENRERWEQILDDLARGRLLVRVIRLHPRYRVPPGETRTQRQARLDRWLPKPFKGDAANMRLSWTSAVRFACPAHSRSIPPRNAPLLIGPVSFDGVMGALRDGGCVARWLDDGQLYIVLSNDRRATPDVSSRAPTTDSR